MAPVGTKDLSEECLDRTRRAGVGGSMVGDPRSAATDRMFVGKAMHGPTVYIELPVRAGLVHLLNEGGDMRDWNMRIQGAVADKDLCLHPRRLLWSGGIETPVNADYSRKLAAGTSECENGHPAKAVADSGQAPIDLRMGRQDGYSRHRSPTEPVGVASEFRDTYHDARTITGYAIAVHVARQNYIAKRRQAPCAPLCVIIETGSPVDDQYTRTHIVSLGVPDKQASEWRISIAVRNFLCLQALHLSDQRQATPVTPTAGTRGCARAGGRRRSGPASPPPRSAPGP